MEATNELMEIANVTADTEPEYLAVKKGTGVFKNVMLGLGIFAGASLAGYGLFELGKKGVRAVKGLMEKNKEKKHPEYRYEKTDDVVEAEKEIKDTLAKAKFRHKKEKHPMGFQYKA